MTKEIQPPASLVISGSLVIGHSGERWATIRDWVEERCPLTADECRALYAAGAADPDPHLGAAMMCVAVYQRYCPADLRRGPHARPTVARAARLMG